MKKVTRLQNTDRFTIGETTLKEEGKRDIDTHIGDM